VTAAVPHPNAMQRLTAALGTKLRRTEEIPHIPQAEPILQEEAEGKEKRKKEQDKKRDRGREKMEEGKYEGKNNRPLLPSVP